jgi:DnaA-homolog protein
MRQLPLELATVPAPELDTFEVGRNAEVLRVLQDWLAGELDERCVYLWGPAGAGKTHLLLGTVAAARAVGHTATYVAPGMPVATPASARSRLVAIDAVDVLDADGQRLLFSLLNAAAADELRLLLCGASPPAGLRVRDDVRTRIAAGLVLQVRPLGDEDKVLALCRHARERGFGLSPEAAGYLLHHGRRDLPSLMAVLDAADRYSLQTKRPVTVPLLREVLHAGDDGNGSG